MAARLPAKILLFACLLAFFIGFAASSAAEARQGDTLTQHFDAAGNASPPDHDAWDRLLRRHVAPGPGGIARFDYAAIDRAERTELDAYLARLAAWQPTSLPRDDQLAYWINLYNALTVKVILDHYPVRSIRNIKFGGLFAFGPWGEELIEVEGRALSLDDIENQIIRPIFDDPRIHYGLNCASLGCPDLRAEAYVGEQIDEQLDDAARTFVNHPRGAEVVDGRLRVSSIYHWFKRDFGGNDEAVIRHLQTYAAPNLDKALGDVDRISRHRYNWRLNDLETE